MNKDFSLKKWDREREWSEDLLCCRRDHFSKDQQRDKKK